jgi:hypothetical protein
MQNISSIMDMRFILGKKLNDVQALKKIPIFGSFGSPQGRIVNRL